MINLASSELAIFLGVIFCALASFATRALPFYLKALSKPSPAIDIIEKYMGLMIMVLLVFYSLKQDDFSSYPYGLPAFVGVLAALFLHLCFKNTLFSIVLSTAIYMCLIRLV